MVTATVSVGRGVSVIDCVGIEVWVANGMVVVGTEDGSFLTGMELLTEEQATKKTVTMITTMILDVMSVSFCVEMNCPTNNYKVS